MVVLLDTVIEAIDTGATPEGRKELVGFTDGTRESSQIVA
jgi:hypothetical protein